MRDGGGGGGDGEGGNKWEGEVQEWGRVVERVCWVGWGGDRGSRAMFKNRSVVAAGNYGKQPIAGEGDGPWLERGSSRGQQAGARHQGGEQQQGQH